MGVELSYSNMPPLISEPTKTSSLRPSSCHPLVPVLLLSPNNAPCTLSFSPNNAPWASSQRACEATGMLFWRRWPLTYFPCGPAQELKEEIYQGAGVEPKEFFEDLSEDEQAAIQAFAQALRNPVIVNVLPRANPNANPRKVNMSTIGGQQLELEVEDNASTLGLRGPVATQIGAHPASLVFVLPSGQLCGHGQDAPLV